jgi:hypothetical protein
MRYSRRIRLVAALVALWSLLFTQLALAAYDCPQAASAAGQPVHMQAAPEQHAGCATPPERPSPNLCEAHGQANAQSLDLPAQPLVAPFIPARLVLAIASVDTPLPPNLEAPASFLETASSSPPISIRHCCLRN